MEGAPGVSAAASLWHKQKHGRPQRTPHAPATSVNHVFQMTAASASACTLARTAACRFSHDMLASCAVHTRARAHTHTHTHTHTHAAGVRVEVGIPSRGAALCVSCARATHGCARTAHMTCMHMHAHFTLRTRNLLTVNTSRPPPPPLIRLHTATRSIFAMVASSSDSCDAVTLCCAWSARGEQAVRVCHHTTPLHTTPHHSHTTSRTSRCS
jgi:hypothetical protein